MGTMLSVQLESYVMRDITFYMDYYEAATHDSRIFNIDLPKIVYLIANLLACWILIF